MAARTRSSSAKEGKESEKDEKQQTFHNPVFRPRANLLELLLHPEFDAISAIGETCLIQDESRALSEAILEVFEGNQKTEKLMEWAFTKEVNTTTNPSTLFRGVCEATKLMPVIYSRLGNVYLKQVAGPLVKDVITSGSSFEIDPNRADKGLDVKDNLIKLKAITSEFISHVINSVDSCPPFLRKIFQIAKAAVVRKFPESGNIIVGVFYFSRFLIPAMVSPDKYGLTLEPPPLESQRGLVLISKLLQNLSNEIEFTDNKNEEFYADLNKYISENMNLMHSFLEKLSVPVEYSKPVFSTTSESINNALSYISLVMRENSAKIYSLLTKAESKRIFVRLMENTPLGRSLSDEILPKSLTPTEDVKQYWTWRKKNNNEQLKKKIETVRLEQMEKMLDQEIRERLKMEKQLADLRAELEHQKTINDAHSKKIAHLEETVRILKGDELPTNLEGTQEPSMQNTSESGNSVPL